MTVEVHRQSLFDNIVEEIQKIQWKVQRTNNQARMLAGFAEEAFRKERILGQAEIPSRQWSRTNARGTQMKVERGVQSSIYTGAAKRLTSMDKEFLRVSRFMDLILVPLLQNDHNILFAYFMSRRGVTRGYPYKDFSVLPEKFNPTKQCFFYIGDPEHNEERTEKWTEPYLCPLSNRWMVTCCCPVYRGDEFIGVVGIDMDLGKIIEPLRIVLNCTKGGYAFLVSPQGSLVISSDEGMNSLRDDSVIVEGNWKDLRGKDPRDPDNMEIKDVALTSGRAHLLRTRFASNDWSLICILPKARKGSVKAIKRRRVEDRSSPAVEPESTVSHQPLMSFVTSFNESLRQIEKLIEGTTMIGRGVLDHRITVERKDEIGLLAMSINKMAKELKKRMDEVTSAYQKISQMDRLAAMGRLIAGIAHEINNPLGIISNYIQILAANANMDPGVQEDIQTIDEEIQRASNIIRGLLDFSGETDIEKNMIWINDVLQRTLGLIRFQIKSRDITLKEEYEENLPFIMGNATHLQQAFLNIMLNSLEAMTDGGRMQVVTKGRVRKTGEKIRRVVEIFLSDTGHGIDRKNLGNIFDPFFTLKGDEGGTGLGLSITYGIIKEHEGAIDVKSTVGKGTIVKITLPALD